MSLEDLPSKTRREFLSSGAATTGLLFAADLTTLGRLSSVVAKVSRSQESFLGATSLNEAVFKADPHYIEIVEAAKSIPQSAPKYSSEITNTILALLTRNAGLRTEQRTSSEMILHPLQAWSTPRWWPIFERTALRLKQPRVHDDWWPAHAYDMEYKNATGTRGDAQEQATSKAEFIQEKRSETESFAGYCPWVAAAQIMDEEPQAFPGETLGGETDPDRIKQLKEGLLTIKRAGSILVRIPARPEVFKTVIRAGIPTILDYPANMGAGNWFRGLLGISEDGSLVRVPNFGMPDVNLPISGVVSAWVVYPADSTEAFAPGIKESTSFWRFNVDRKFIDHRVYRR